jgi:hypothetical protein
MVVGVAHTDVEDDSAPQFREIFSHCRAISHNELGQLQIANSHRRVGSIRISQKGSAIQARP